MFEVQDRVWSSKEIIKLCVASCGAFYFVVGIFASANEWSWIVVNLWESRGNFL
jgi:hypothetical protein